ncbi:MAG: type II toxin-antitoxin system RelE/ParE family toxin [Phycisphaerae bacterium]|nr:type II toxin-antitoxin system RelE/ParE family toxin [Phycisphaerae bacterium]
MKARVHPAAVAEILAASRWYGEQLVNLGDDFLDEYKAVVAQIETNPRRFPKTPRPANREVRRARTRRFPYVVIYQLRNDACVIIAVAHAHRRPNYWGSRLG